MHRLVVTFALAAVSAAFFVSGAGAAPAPTGPQLSDFGPAQQTFPAGQPFHFRVGWGNSPSGDGGVGLWTFSLTVDGVAQMGFLDQQVSTNPGSGPPLILRPYLFNFPQGMTGTHTFAGTFYGPCAQMVSQGFATGPCSSSNEIVPVNTLSPFTTTTITFVP